MESCYFIDKYGAIKVEKMNKEDIAYTMLKCVNNGKLKISEMYYPLILASTPDKYLQKIKIALDAVKNNIHYIPITPKGNSQEHYIIVYKNDKFLCNAILQAFLFLNFQHLENDDFNPVSYIINNLHGFDKNYNKRYFMQKYINRILPKELPKKVYNIISNPKLNSHQKYIAKYKLAKNNDNFKSFNLLFNKLEKNATILLNTVKLSPLLTKYSKTIKPAKFTFSVKNSIGKNPMYSLVKNDVHTYAKSINVKI